MRPLLSDSEQRSRAGRAAGEAALSLAGVSDRLIDLWQNLGLVPDNGESERARE